MLGNGEKPSVTTSLFAFVFIAYLLYYTPILDLCIVTINNIIIIVLIILLTSITLRACLWACS